MPRRRIAPHGLSMPSSPVRAPPRRDDGRNPHQQIDINGLRQSGHADHSSPQEPCGCPTPSKQCGVRPRQVVASATRSATKPSVASAANCPSRHCFAPIAVGRRCPAGARSLPRAAAGRGFPRRSEASCARTRIVAAGAADRAVFQSDIGCAAFRRRARPPFCGWGGWGDVR